MFEVSITAGRREYRRTVPESWKEVPVSRRLAWWRLCISEPDTAPALILKDILDLPRSLWRSMSDVNKGSILSRLSWLMPAPGCEDVPIQSFRHQGRDYYLPRPKFENGTCLEFVLADGYYKDYIDTGDPEQLLKLTATLCREKKRDRKEALLTGDERVTLLQKEEVDDRAQRLIALDPAIQAAVLLYFEGVKIYIAQTYWMLFENKQRPEGADADAEQEPTSDGPKFGWWSIFLQVAKANIFGEYEAVLQRRLHKICMHLVDEHDINEKQQAELDRQRAKNNSLSS
jgi:hypothetical protein